MRLLIPLALSLPLAAQGSLAPYLPGHDKDLYHQVKAQQRAEATVEIRGTLTREELRQIHFQEFLDWFIPDVRAYLGRYGDVAAPVPVAVQLTEPPAQAKVYPVGPAAGF